jgi:hypothetical protein
MEENTFFDDETEELFGAFLGRFLIEKHPNPQRIGCPDPGIIRDLAFRRKIAPDTRKSAISHLMKCSECVRDALDCVEEYRQTTEE